ncbi:MAG: hypothetical protein J6Y23_03500 [Prevotella sp.]|nr:hypothetical protein [Prevotella sp.]
MEKQEKSKLIVENYDTVITIRDTLKDGMHTLTVEENGCVYYQQSKHLGLPHKETETFLEKFLQLFNCCYNEVVGSKNDEIFNQKLESTLQKVLDEADNQEPQSSNPRLVVAFDIIDKDRKPIIKECHNTIEVELAEDELSKGDYLFVLRELAGAVDKMASKGLATRLFYQRPVTTPQEMPYIPNRKGLVRDFEFLSYRSQIQATPQGGHTSPLTGLSH